MSAGNQKISVTDILAAGSTVEITIEDPETGIEVTQEVPQNPLFRVYDVTCGANGKLTIEADPANDIPLEDIMIITDCNITFTQGSEIRNARIITTSTDIKSIEAPSDLTVGSEATGGNCGSGAQFVTLGGVDFASSVNFDSSQIIAKRDISFTANGNGQTGVSLISGGNITATANGDMNVCKSGMLSGMIIKQFRMAM